MSVKVMAHAWELKLPPTLKLVLLSYADHANHDGGNMFPCTDTVAMKSGLSIRSVQRSLKELIDMGVLIQTGKTKRTRQRILRYNWNYPDKPNDTGVVDDIDDVELNDRESLSDDENDRESLSEPAINHHLKQPSLKDSVPDDKLVSFENKMLLHWSRLFPKKTQPRPGTHRAKIKTRMKDKRWMIQVRPALEKASRSNHLLTSGWFQFEYIVRNDDNISKILQGVFDSFDEDGPRNKSMDVLRDFVEDGD